jgi:3-hydroxybutyryl-CoA dehydrogenase
VSVTLDGTLDGTVVAVVGLGPMGRGIARVFDAAGARVHVVDVSPEVTAAQLDRARAEAQADGATLANTTVADLRTAVQQADVLIEATIEDMAVKRALLDQVRELAGPELIVASNTSSLSIGELGQSFGDPARVVGMHFFNPPTRMRLVEVVVAAGTSTATADRARELVAALGKTVVTCADSPNFIVNRVCRPLYYEAQLLVTQGMAPGAVDAAASGALGHPMGPLTLLDFTGLHTHLGSSQTALREFGDPRYRPIPVTRTLVRAGMTGRAAGRGFYDYAQEKPRAAVARLLRVPGSAGHPVRVTPAGPGADRLAAMLPDDARAQAGGLPVYRCGAPREADVRAVRDLAAVGPVAVDSSDGHWLDALPAGAGWLHLHQTPAGGLFAEVVRDEVAGIDVPGCVGDLLDSLAAPSVEVLALPGLVVDRLAHCMANEASMLVEERIAVAPDIDRALQLGMNHPRGPFGQLEADGVAAVYASLVSMAELTGDPRYRPAQLLRRQAARH